RSHEHGMPLRTCANLRDAIHAGFDDADGIEAAGVDNNAARDLCLPEKRMRLTAHRDLKSLAVRKLHELRDVLRIAGPEYGDRLLVDHVSKVISRPLRCGIIDEQLAAESLQIIP